MLLLGERQSAQDLRRLGLVNRVVPPEQLMATALQLAGAVISGSRTSVAALKRITTHADRALLGRVLDLEAQETIAAISREDAVMRARSHTVARG